METHTVTTYIVLNNAQNAVQHNENEDTVKTYKEVTLFSEPLWKPLGDTLMMARDKRAKRFASGLRRKNNVER